MQVEYDGFSFQTVDLQECPPFEDFCDRLRAYDNNLKPQKGFIGDSLVIAYNYNKSWPNPIDLLNTTEEIRRDVKDTLRYISSEVEVLSSELKLSLTTDFGLSLSRKRFAIVYIDTSHDHL